LSRFEYKIRLNSTNVTPQSYSCEPPGRTISKI